MEPTAVEWLVDILLHKVQLTEIEKIYIEKAKQMEKEQLIETWKHGNLPTFLGKTLTAEEYYNKTYKTNKE
jgi:hypothetical protein